MTHGESVIGIYNNPSYDNRKESMKSRLEMLQEMGIIDKDIPINPLAVECGKESVVNFITTLKETEGLILPEDSDLSVKIMNYACVRYAILEKYNPDHLASELNNEFVIGDIHSEKTI